MDGECCSREEFVKHFVPSAFGFLGTQVCVRGGLALAITSSGWQLDDGSFFFVLVASIQHDGKRAVLLPRGADFEISFERE